MTLQINENYKKLNSHNISQYENVKAVHEASAKLVEQARQLLDFYENRNVAETEKVTSVNNEFTQSNTIGNEPIELETENIQVTEKPLKFDEMSVDMDILKNVDIDGILAQNKENAMNSYSEMQNSMNNLNSSMQKIDIQSVLADIESAYEEKTQNADIGMSM
jgi:hypothetical protein